MGGLLGKSKSSSGGEEVWRQDSQFENRLAHQHYPDTWGGVTSYNLLDLQVATMETPLFVTGTTDSLTGERRSLCKVSLVHDLVYMHFTFFATLSPVLIKSV